MTNFFFFFSVLYTAVGYICFNPKRKFVVDTTSLISVTMYLQSLSSLTALQSVQREFSELCSTCGFMGHCKQRLIAELNLTVTIPSNAWVP